MLDLYCGAGGCAVGYNRAGFEVTGVDINEQPNYPFTFIQSDVFDLEIDYDDFDLIHAIPPAYTEWIGVLILQ
jgi:DNA (cytosine-5)-methyltransferase 1